MGRSGFFVASTDTLIPRRNIMSTEKNKALIRRWCEVRLTEDAEAKVEEFHAPGFVGHSPQIELKG